MNSDEVAQYKLLLQEQGQIAPILKLQQHLQNAYLALVRDEAAPHKQRLLHKGFCFYLNSVRVTT